MDVGFLIQEIYQILIFVEHKPLFSKEWGCSSALNLIKIKVSVLGRYMVSSLTYMLITLQHV